MKKVKLFLAFVFFVTMALCFSSCEALSSINIPGLNKDTCAEHTDLNEDAVCDECGVAIPVNCPKHEDLNHDGKCDTKGCTATLKLIHFDEDENGECDVCGAETLVPCSKHKDLNHDGKCDTKGCTETLDVLHFDEDENGECDSCGAYVELPPPCEHVDWNLDGKCDLCKKKSDESIPIYENGEMNFKIVLAQGTTGHRALIVNNMLSDLESFGVNAEMRADKIGEEVEYEVFFGSPTNRGDEYKIDAHLYGAKGYVVKLIGTKIIVVSGSEDSFQAAVDAFKESFLGITPDTKRLGSRYITEAQNISKIQDDYDVSAITLFGKDIKGYTIAVSKEDKDTYRTAQKLQDLLYRQTGYWLDIVSLEEADKSIVIAMQEKNTDREGFYATFTDGKMEFISEYPTVIESKVINFFEGELTKSVSAGTLAIDAEDCFTSDVRYVYYEDFGAVGDGITDDSKAISDAHEYANLGGHKVLAGKNKTYYIGKLEYTIHIRTDVDWLDATFIIDDSIIAPDDKSPSGIKYRSVNIFTVSIASTISSFSFAEKVKEINASGGIDASKFTGFDVELGMPLLVEITNSHHKNYIRYGANANSGTVQKELVLVDEHGNLDPSTPFMHDFEYITGYHLYQITEEPITIEGGNFKTKPFKSNSLQSYTAYARGIKCSRSNVTFKNIKHYLIEEATSSEHGCPYGGFFTTSYANNIVYDNCQFAAHIEFSEAGKSASMGSYDISPAYSTNVIYKSCYQEENNFFESGRRRWGVMGSSYCKNITYIDSMLTRFDAHNGVHNASIINTEIKSIRINGTGTFLMENCTLHSSNGRLIDLREDYGGFWDGDVILKNNTVITSSTLNIFTNRWRNHDFGYPARYPTNIIIDGLEIYRDRGKTKPSSATVNLFASVILSGSSNIMKDYFPQYTNSVMLENKNQATAPERVIIRNCQNLEAQISVPAKQSYPWFKNTTFSINEETECTSHFDHSYDGKCDDCGAAFVPCTKHVDSNNDGKCCFCNEDVEILCDKHIDKNLNARCDICNAHYVCDGHTDTNKDRICDKCGGALGCGDSSHIDRGNDGYCDICTKIIPTCEGKCVDECDKYKREIRDSKCDKCSADIVATS